jgi:hypothetical protein
MTRHAALGAMLAVFVAAPAAASHGQLVGGVVVESANLRSVVTPEQVGACAIGGAVQNASPGPVLVRVTYEARDPAGVLLVARVRLAGVVAGERRTFTSSPLSRSDGTYEPCAGIRDITMEAAAEPAR